MKDLIHQGITNFPISSTMETIIGAIIAGFVAYLWYRFRRIENRIEESVSKKETREFIDDKTNLYLCRIEKLEKEITVLNAKWDKLLLELLNYYD